MSQSGIFPRPIRRRQAVLGAGLGLAPWLAATAQAEDADSIRPQPGDHFVFLTDPKQGQIVKLEDLPVGGPQEQAYPVDQASGVVRNGSPLNLVVLARFDPAALSADTLAHAADGVVAYSAICTHQGCPVNMWEPKRGSLYCSCHGSQYDPRDDAKVVDGPAPSRLAALPIKIEGGVVVVAGGFTRRLGAQTSA